jgi:hypothetical protein
MLVLDGAAEEAGIDHDSHDEACRPLSGEADTAVATRHARMTLEYIMTVVFERLWVNYKRRKREINE